MTQISLKLTSGPRDFRVKTSRWREWGRVRGFEGTNLDSFTNLCASFESAVQEPLSSKTFTAFFLATEDEILLSYSRRWMKSGMVSHGVCLTAKTSESPSNAAASTLLPCMETGEVPEKYYLSPNAATGILRRADRMKRNLGPSFRRSLEILSGVPS